MIYDDADEGSEVFVDCNLSWEYPVTTMDFMQKLNYMLCDEQ